MQTLDGIAQPAAGAPALDLPAPLAFWRLDDTSDSVGTATLTNNNGVTFVAGKIGNCASFDGATNWLSLASSSLTQINGDFTIAGWVNKAGLAGPIWNKTYFPAPPNDIEWFVTERSDGSPQFSMTSDGSTAQTVIGSVMASGWNFVAAWYDSVAKQMFIRVTSTVVGPTNFTGTPFTSTVDFEMGSYVFGTRKYWSGKTDAVGIWHQVLTTTQLNNLYNGGTGREYYSGAWH